MKDAPTDPLNEKEGVNRMSSSFSKLDPVLSNRFYRVLLQLLPILLSIIAASVSATHAIRFERTTKIIEYSQPIISLVEQNIKDLMRLITYCSESPDLLQRVDLSRVAESCGRYASQLGGWVVLIELGQTHRHILNTRPDAGKTLPMYPRNDERRPLLEAELRSRMSGRAEIVEVFSGILYPKGIISAVKYIEIADGRSVMMYVSIAAETLSSLLSAVTEPNHIEIVVYDSARKAVAGSNLDDQMLRTDPPEWTKQLLGSEKFKTNLLLAGKEGKWRDWDAVYSPINTAPGWFALIYHRASGLIDNKGIVHLTLFIVFGGFAVSAVFAWWLASCDQLRKVIDEAHLKVKEAEIQNREKSRILGSFAHDVRGPLASIISLLRTNRRLAKNQLLQDLARSAESTLQLIDDIMDMKYLSSSGFVLNESLVDIKSIAQAAIDRVSLMAHDKSISLKLSIDAELPYFISVDKLRLAQVLHNLLTNAVKYTRAGLVTLEMHKVSMSDHTVTVRFLVRDTGVGISEEDTPKVLRQFVRLDRQIEKEQRGIGLGLSLVQKVLATMESKLTISSELGKGSTFAFEIVRPFAHETASVEDGIEPIANVTILYVEDDPLTRRITEQQLKIAGARVVCAFDALDALGQLKVSIPDVILLDLNTPRMTATSFLEEIREIVESHGIAVFALSSENGRHFGGDERYQTINAFFQKPLNNVEFQKTVAACLSRKKSDDRPSTLGSYTAIGENIERETFLSVVLSDFEVRDGTIIEEFDLTLRADIDLLEGYAATYDIGCVEEIAHRCYGVCLVFGAKKLAIMFRNIEDCAKSGDFNELQQKVLDLRRVLNHTVQEMKGIFWKTLDGPLK